MSTVRVAAALLIVGVAVLLTPVPAADKKPKPLKGTNYPDLVIQSFSIVKTECKGGRPFVTASATVKNVSSKHAADLRQIPFRQVLAVNVANNKKCPGVIEEQPGGPEQIAALGTWVGTAERCFLPSGASGTNYLSAVADPLHLVAEINENNNVVSLLLPNENPCK